METERDGVGEDEEENASSMLTSPFDIAKNRTVGADAKLGEFKDFIVEGLIEREKLRKFLNDFPPALDDGGE